MKKIWLIIILIIVLAGIGFFVFRFLSKPKSDTETIKTSQIEPSATPTPEAPEKYEVPILMYHYIRVADETNKLGYALSVAPANFDKQMSWLKEHDYVSLKLEDLADPQKQVLAQILNQNKKPVIITFDDGYSDAYTNAFPVLQKHNMIGTFFIIRDKVGKDDSFYLNQKQIDKMAAAGMEIGSHSLSHPDLAKLNNEKALLQISGSKQTATVFCYPAGRFNDQTPKLIQQAGYKAAVTTQGGIANQDSDLFLLPRLRIENINLENFAKKFNYE